MRRIQFIEIHERPWLPSSLRDDITDTLQFGLNLFHAYAPIAPLLQRAIDSTGNGTSSGRSIVDLCSGGGGPWFDLSRKLQSRTPEGAPAPLQIWLTDQYPNLRALHNARAESEHQITFYQDPVDAMKVPGELTGFRTMFTSFHHFLPEDARAILQNAVDAGESIGIFEVTRRAPSTICMVIAFDLILSVCTPWVRPFRWSRLFFTYLVPIIPFVLLFDGVVSCLRTYQPQELRDMVEQLRASEYQWEIGEHSTGVTPVTYLMGWRRGTR